MAFITGNTFPLSLVRREVIVRPRSMADYQEQLKSTAWVSFWGHSNTLNIVNRLTGMDLRPACERPALSLSEDYYPVLHGQVFKECWVLSPDYRPGYRPALQEEPTPGDIVSWQVLQLLWV